MTDSELKKLSRKELLEMLISQSKELQSLQEKLTAAEAALQKKEIIINEAGSIAEAALQLSGIFDAAQEACQQYTDNIIQLSQRQEEICAQREADSQARARRVLEEVKREKAKLEEETKINCEEMTRKAKAESQAYWDDVSSKLEAFLSQHAELSQLLSVMMPNRHAPN